MAYVFFLLFFLCFAISTAADLNSDELALLAFAASIPHGRKLNWSTQNPICSSWVGVKCTPDQSRVSSLRLPAVGLFGPLPSDTLAKLDALEVLSLRSNRLTADLPSNVSAIPSLHSLYLQHNNLSGAIPSSLSSNLSFLDLSYNSFVGEIPPTIQNLTQLTALYLENNSLTGVIPDVQFTRLKHLNLSYNNLSGSIPPFFQRFSVDSFLGNPFLCGFPLAQCVIPPSSAPVESPLASAAKPRRSFWKRFKWIIVAIVAGAFAFILLTVVIILLCVYWRKRKQGSRSPKGKGLVGGRVEKPEEYSSSAQEAQKNKLVFFEGSSYNFDLEDLLRASAEVLGKGSYGTTYRAVLEDSTMVVVKRLKEVVVGKREFEQQMEMVGKIRQHPNVMPLRAYYYSKDEKLLVFDYASSGNFSTLLHGHKNSGKTPIGWDTRVKICLEVARGIAHIHSEGGGKLTHGNIKSSNVLLSQDLDASVSDYGLAPLMNTAATSSRAAVGYRAPEFIETRKCTQKSDVYSFGVLLLEMLTGKTPLQSPGRDDVVDLPRWVQSVVREEWTAEVFDADLVRHVDIEDELVHVLQIAMQCVAKVPDQRPKMDDVIHRLEEVRNSDSENRTSSEEKPKEESGQSPSASVNV